MEKVLENFFEYFNQSFLNKVGDHIFIFWPKFFLITRRSCAKLHVQEIEK